MPLKLVFFACLASIANAVDYCSISNEHTMCRFGREIGHFCGAGSEGGVTRSEIETIIKVHNDYRIAVANGRENRGQPGPQPPAANMRALVWDDELAEVAQRWADQCNFQHDRCRDDERFKVGQNIYWSSGMSKVDWTRAVEAWYDEVAQLEPSQVSRYDFDYNTGHYAQLASATTRYVGCARRSYGGSYRLRGTRPLEYVLSPVPETNDTAPDAEPGYFGIDKIDLTAAGKGAITSANKPRETHVVTDPKRQPKLEPGYFGGAALDPQGTLGAATRPKVNKSTVYQPSNGPYVSYYPIYEATNGRYVIKYPTNQQYTGETLQSIETGGSDNELSDSSDESDEDIDDGEDEEKKQISFEPPSTIQMNTWTSDGWKILNYDFNRDHILICNYGPAGHLVGEPIYEEGSPCSKCPDGTVCQDGLCH